MISCNDKESNPLLLEWNTPFQTPPFEQIKNEHYLPAFKQAIDLAKAEITQIAENKENPTFDNTILALETSGKLLNRAANVFFNLEAAETNDTLQMVAQEVSPMLTEYSNSIYLNNKLLERVKIIKENAKALNSEQQMLLNNTYTAFVRSGANLSEKDKEKFREISTQLSVATLKFGQNVLAATNSYILHITNATDLKGLPEGIIESAAGDAKNRNLEGWVFTLQQPSYMPFVKYAENRNLREKLYKAYNSKATSGDKSNVELINQIINLRIQQSQLLGYKSYAEYSLEKSMAKNVDACYNLLNDLIEASKPVAIEELSALQKFAETQGADFKIMPWDFSFYSEKLKISKYNLDDELTRPYFKLDNVTEGVFKLSNILFGLNYELRNDIPLYHPDVQTYKVTNKDGKYIAILYLDFFPREGKGGGAWMTNYREQSNVNGEEQRPIVSLVCNFTKPTKNKPSLLTFAEVETYLHEFGHGLHGMLSEITYESLAGTNVYRDFVELPSQIMENWCVEKEFLDMFASHYETGEKIPESLVDAIVEGRNFMEGYTSMRQLNFGCLDLAYHTMQTPFNEDVFAFEKEATKNTRVLPEVEGDLISSSFSHIFAGGYAAGYYSYKWSEVLDADAFSVFKKKGIFNTEVAELFRENILSKGGTKDPMELYKAFKGEEPTTEALLIRSGLKKSKIKHR